MKPIFILCLCLTIGACTTKNKHVLDKNSEHYGKAFLIYNFNNLYLEKVNGKKYKQTGLFEIKVEGTYIKPGYTTVEIRHRYSTNIKKLCFIAKPGDTVSITLVPSLSNKHTYPYSVHTFEKLFGPIKERLGIACKN